ncbi:MAG: outer membrane protein assembly factor, partial [Stenotrophobium sp.]
LDYDVYKNYGAAVFVDAGGADDVPNVLLHYGAGIGFRYRAPFGAVAIDLAHPFDRGASPVRLHIGMRVGL